MGDAAALTIVKPYSEFIYSLFEGGASFVDRFVVHHVCLCLLSCQFFAAL